MKTYVIKNTKQIIASKGKEKFPKKYSGNLIIKAL
jgi:hypothetical protein